MSLRPRAACKFFSASALALMLGSSALLADVTPEEVWQIWQDAAIAEGNTVTAHSIRREGDSLILKDITIKSAQKAEAQLPGLTFKDRGDGTVAMILPDSYKVMLHLPATPGGAFKTAADLVMAVTVPGATILASGTPDALSVTTNLPKVALALDKFNGISATTADVVAEIRGTGISSHYRVTKGEKLTLAADYAAESLSFAFKSPNKGKDLDLSFGIADLSASIEAVLPKGRTLGGSPDVLAAALAEGLSLSLKATYGATRFDTATRNAKGAGLPVAGNPSKISAAMAKGGLQVVIDATKLDYSLNSEGGSISLAGQIPLPDASMTYGGIAAHILIPVAESAKPAPFAFGLSLDDVALSDPIWALIDPTKALIHDAASLDLDAGGQVTILHSPFLHPEGKLGLPVGQQMAELNSFDIANLTLKALGADVTALGGLTIDYGSPGRKRGEPVPSGKIDIAATGLSKLLDGLVKVGVIPQDHAMQARMMLSMFANASTTSDALTTRLEFRDAHFFVNGQKVQ